MSDDLVKRLREGNNWDWEMMNMGGEAADRIEALERLEKQMPAIIEYLEQQADVVDGDNGIPHPNKAMTLLVWLRHEVEKKDEQ
jgi:endo-1,4-beta-mannosidase